jgi:tRNA threonylcarbamoyladenosine modification (KEOPS) complex  Pcc1 subunit
LGCVHGPDSGELDRWEIEIDYDFFGFIGKVDPDRLVECNHPDECVLLQVVISFDRKQNAKMGFDTFRIFLVIDAHKLVESRPVIETWLKDICQVLGQRVLGILVLGV